jgi:hypothetical protein
MEGSLTGDRISGTLRLTNLAPRRADNVNVPTLRGVFTTDDGARVWVEIDGLATLRQEDSARVVLTMCRFRTGDDRYDWLNTLFAVLEGILDTAQALLIPVARLTFAGGSVTLIGSIAPEGQCAAEGVPRTVPSGVHGSGT